uniref:DUF3187 family protein n=1 Tax=Thaumasiovibrio occultus TaxID=1891184 RepID=UPI000B362405|nr:DUF3187 family protein [Thaumasiovibrio occultus]
MKKYQYHSRTAVSLAVLNFFAALVTDTAEARCAADCETNWGPITSVSPAPLHALSLTPQIEPVGAINQVQVNVVIASVWAQTPEYELDYYHNDLQLQWRQAFSEHHSIGVRYHFQHATNNYLDSLSLGFHRTFGIDQNGRDTVDRHRQSITLPSLDAPLELSHRTLNSSFQLDYYYHQPLSQRQWGASLSYRTTSHGPFSGAGWSGAINVAQQWQHHAHSWIAMGALALHSNNEWQGVALKPLTWHIGVSYQYQLATRHTLALQWLIHDGRAETLASLDDWVHEINLGYRYLLTPLQAIELSVTQNLIDHDNSADVAFTLNYRKQY